MEVLEKLRLINEIFWECSNEFQYMGLVLAAVLFLYCFRRDHMRGRRMAAFVMLFFILLAVPPFVWMSELILGEADLIRLLWIVSSVFLISYAAVLYGSTLLKKSARAMWIAACILLAILAGDTVSQGGVFQKNEYTNAYQVSEEDLEICKILENTSEDAVVLGANLDQIRAIRRVNPQTKVIYGADMKSLLIPEQEGAAEQYSVQEEEYSGRSVEEQIEENKYDQERIQLFAYMQSDDVILEMVMESSQELGVNCIVFDKQKNYSRPISVLVEDNEAEIIGETENYWVVQLLI